MTLHDIQYSFKWHFEKLQYSMQVESVTAQLHAMEQGSELGQKIGW